MLQIYILSGIGILAMISELISFRKWMPVIALFGLAMIIGTVTMHWGVQKSWYNNMMAEDRFDKSIILISSVIFLLWIILFRDTLRDERTVAEYIALLCFSVVGGYMMVTFSNLVMLFLGVEILSIPVYVLAGSNKKSLKSNESAFKYFLMGAFASGFLLFGMTFLYGATGSFDILSIHNYYGSHAGSMPFFFKIGLIMLVFGLGFKLSAVPFHFWTPDVYEGAPNHVTAFMATMVKGFAAAAAFRLFNGVLHDVSGGMLTVLAVLSGLSMVIGNTLGAIQDNPKRLLAYSSIGHAGFMMLAIYAGTQLGAQALVYYIASYTLASLLALFITHKVLIKDDAYWSIGDFAGLFSRNRLLAIGMSIALLSMAGIPPLSGFFAKYFIFNLAYQHGRLDLVIVAIVSSLIGVYYYFKFISAMFGRHADQDIDWHILLTGLDKAVIILLVAMIILLGLMPDTILGLLA
mgnify:CR=1 FL=1